MVTLLIYCTSVVVDAPLWVLHEYTLTGLNQDPVQDNDVAGATSLSADVEHGSLFKEDFCGSDSASDVANTPPTRQQSTRSDST